MNTEAQDIEMLSRAILTEVRDEAEQIKAEAKEKAEAIRKRAQEQAERERKAILDRAREEPGRVAPAHVGNCPHHEMGHRGGAEHGRQGLERFPV